MGNPISMKMYTALGVMLVVAVAHGYQVDGPLSMDEAVVIQEAAIFLQVDGPSSYVEVPEHRVPLTTKEIRTLKASQDKCQAECNKEEKCKGFKYTDGTQVCTLLAHDGTAAPAAQKPKAAAPPEKKATMKE